MIFLTQFKLLIPRKLNSFLIFKNNLHLCTSFFKNNTNANDDVYDEILYADREYLTFSSNYFKLDAKNCYIVQPYVKWGPQKLQGITPTEQLDEAKALVKTLPSWGIAESITVPLDTMDKKTLFKSGSLEKLRQNIKNNLGVDAVFINVGTLKKIQMINLEKEFGVPILDRYRVVMQILKMHAVSKHAKLQVALAELYYLQKTTINEMTFSKQDREKIKLMFQAREQKLKNAIQDLRVERTLLRNRRQKHDFPVIAVVGYTNAGKTSIIKALTGEDKLQPRNQLFATLDVTLHAGLLPSGLEVLYVDTVGFISDIPTNLIECFVATLEDAVLADVILHVEDIASSCFEFKRKHVLKTLQDLGNTMNYAQILDKVISVGNKCDLVTTDRDFGILQVSSKTDQGLDVLREQLQAAVIANTNRLQLKIRVSSGGDEIRWLYKNATVVSETVDTNNNQLILANVIITNKKLQQFKHHYT